MKDLAFIRYWFDSDMDIGIEFSIDGHDGIMVLEASKGGRHVVLIDADEYIVEALGKVSNEYFGKDLDFDEVAKFLKVLEQIGFELVL